MREEIVFLTQKEQEQTEKIRSLEEVGDSIMHWMRYEFYNTWLDSTANSLHILCTVAEVHFVCYTKELSILLY